MYLPGCERDDGEAKNGVEVVLRLPSAGETEGELHPVDECAKEDLDEVHHEQCQSDFLWTQK